jgi:hypothetical protein
MSPWVRRVVVVAAGLVAWLVAVPAFAAAPLCDDRGAIMLAPAPILDTPSASVDVGDTFECKDMHAFDASCREGRGTDEPSPSPRHFAVLTSKVPVLRPSVLPAAILFACSAPRPGVHDRVERPPR